MLLQALIKIIRADTGNYNRHQEQQYRKDCKGSQTLSRWLVVLLSEKVGSIHADELEEEIGERDEVDDDDKDHAGDGFAAYPEGGEEQENECYGKSSRCEALLNGLGVVDHDEELNREGEEEEEIELEECNVNLWAELAI